MVTSTTFRTCFLLEDLPGGHLEGAFFLCQALPHELRTSVEVALGRGVLQHVEDLS